MNREQIIAGLQAGRTLVIDRKDAPALPICLELETEGLVTQEFVQYDEQSSAIKFRWNPEANMQDPVWVQRSAAQLAHAEAAVRELTEALEGVIAEADRETTSFRRARAALVKYGAKS